MSDLGKILTGILGALKIPKEVEERAHRALQEQFDEIRTLPDKADRAAATADFIYRSLLLEEAGIVLRAGKEMRSGLLEDFGLDVMRIFESAVNAANRARKAKKEEPGGEPEAEHSGCRHADALIAVIKTLKSPIDAEDKIGHLQEQLSPDAVRKLGLRGWV